MTQVLLVDDDVESGEILTEYLEREGFHAMAVQDGAAGVATLCLASMGSWYWR